MISETLLLVDDNEDVLNTLELLLCEEFKEILATNRPDNILSLLSFRRVDAVILDMNFSSGINTGNEGLYWLQRIHELQPELPVVMLTAYGNVELAVTALKNGAADFILKPWENQKIIDTLRSVCQRQQKKEEKPRNSFNHKPETIIGTSSVMQKLFKMVHRVATTDANILLTGENGTGKEVIAKEIHRLSNRNQHPIVSVDMGAVSETLFESELFGHEKGSFTSAIKQKKGKFELAHGGTIFLDEIGDMSLEAQAKVLRALQENKISRIGGDNDINVDVRVIAATNKNLKEEIAKGKFREDLYHRLSVIIIEVPALKERPEDIGELTNYFLKEICEEMGIACKTITPEALETLKNYEWTGNIRELRNVVERLIILGSQNISKEEVELYR